MQDFPTRKVVYVFLASPGDLHEERRIAKGVVDEINNCTAKPLGFEIQLLGWEDTLPGFGRPQGIINKDVNACQLFIGMLWQRWGQSTGEYSSGFEEEYERAHERRQQTQSPEIWLFFKKIDPDRLSDPGEQLRKVVAFRTGLEAAKSIFFKEFSDYADWEKQLREYLSRYLVDLISPSLPATAQPMPATPVADQPNPSGVSPPPGGVVLEQSKIEQLEDLLASVKSAVVNKQLEFSGDSGESLGEFHIARLALLGATFLADRYNDQFLGIRAGNLLYQYRDQLTANQGEKGLILRSLFADEIELLPGWYWFRGLKATEMENVLFYFATKDASSLVRSSVVELLSSPKTAAITERLKERGLLEKVLVDDSESVGKTGLRCIGRIGGLDDLALIARASDDPDPGIREEAVHARLLILFRHDPNRALTELVQTEGEPRPEDLIQMKTRIADMDRSVLLDAIKSPQAKIREFVINELSRRCGLTKEHASSLLSDESLEVRATCLRTLISQGVQFTPEQIREKLKISGTYGAAFGVLSGVADEADELILAQFRRLPLEELVKKIQWYGEEGETAYRVVALDHFAAHSERIRTDLEDRFERMRQEAIDNLQKEFGLQGASLVEKWKTVDEYIRKNFVAAALAGIADHGEKKDIALARRYLLGSSKEVECEAIRVVERFGDTSDVQTLLRVAENSDGKIKQIAARAALRLSPGVNGAAAGLLQRQDLMLVGMALSALRDEPGKEATSLVESLLHNTSEKMRVMALSWIERKDSESEKEELLQA